MNRSVWKNRVIFFIRSKGFTIANLFSLFYTIDKIKKPTDGRKWSSVCYPLQWTRIRDRPGITVTLLRTGNPQIKTNRLPVLWQIATNASPLRINRWIVLTGKREQERVADCPGRKNTTLLRRWQHGANRAVWSTTSPPFSQFFHRLWENEENRNGRRLFGCIILLSILGYVAIAKRLRPPIQNWAPWLRRQAMARENRSQQWECLAYYKRKPKRSFDECCWSFAC